MVIRTDFLKVSERFQFLKTLNYSPLVTITGVFMLLIAGFLWLFAGGAAFIGIGMSTSVNGGDWTDGVFAYGALILGLFLGIMCLVGVVAFVRRKVWAYWLVIIISSLGELAVVGYAVWDAFTSYTTMTELLLGSLIVLLPAAIPFLLYRYREYYLEALPAQPLQGSAIQTSHVHHYYEVLAGVVALLLAVPVVLQGLLGDLATIPFFVGLLGVVSIILLLYSSSSVKLLYAAGAILLLFGIVIELLGPHAEDILTPASSTYYVNGLLITPVKTFTSPDPFGSFVIVAGALIIVWVYVSTRASKAGV